MTPQRKTLVPTKAITAERLARWALHLENDHATPLVLFGMGHDHNQGKLVVCTVNAEEMDIRTLRLCLRAALAQLGDG